MFGPPVLKSASLRSDAYFLVRATRGQAWLSGSMNEADVRAGLDHTLEVRLSDADWPNELLSSDNDGNADSDGALQLIENLEAPLTELAGFHYVLKPTLTVARVDSGLLRITIPGSAAYSIASPETLHLSIPGGALSTRVDQPVEGYVVINATGGTVTVGGKLTRLSTEASLRDVASPQELELTLSDDEWLSDALLDAETGSLADTARIDVFSQSGVDTFGWDNVVRPRLQGIGATLLNSSTLRLSFPPFPSYDISTPETLTLFIPSTAVMSRQPITLGNALIIRAKSGSARLGGTLVLAALRGPFTNVSESYQLQLDIQQDTSNQPFESLSRWAPSLGTPDPSEASDQLLSALRALPVGIALSNVSTMGEHNLLNYSHMRLLDNFTLRLNVTVPRDLYTPVVNLTLADLPSTVFACCNATRPVQLVVTWFEHVEELPTGVFERYNDEASLVALAPSHLVSGAWQPNLLAQAGASTLQHTLEISLYGDAWKPELGEPGSQATAQLLAGLTSAQNEPHGWNAVVQARLSAANLRRESDTLAVVTLPNSADYSVDAPDTIEITISAACLRSDELIHVDRTVASPVWARWPALQVHPLVISPIAGSALVTTDIVSEADLKRGGRKINITLVGDTWVDAVGRTDLSGAGLEVNAEIVRGLASSNMDAFHSTGWNRVAQSTLAFLATSLALVHRVSDTLITIDVPFVSGYDISALDTVTVTVPPSAVRTYMTTPGDSFVVRPVAGQATLGGSLALHATEATLRTQDTLLSITLSHDSWAAGSGELENMADATALLILGAAVASTTQDFGWNNIVRPALLQAWDDGVASRASAAAAAAATAAAAAADGTVVEEVDADAEPLPMVLLRPKRHLVEIRLPTLTTYRILEPETVQITLPGETLRSGSEIEIWPSLVIRPSPASPHVLLSFSSADCTGSDVNQVCTGSSHVAESQLSAPPTDARGTRMIITLGDDAWVDGIDGGEGEGSVAMLRAVRSASEAEASGFNAVFRKQLDWRNMSLINHKTLEFLLPSPPQYGLLAPETLTIVIPASAVLSARAMEANPLVIEAEVGAVQLSGSLSGSCTDRALRSTEALDLYITLQGDSFVAGVGMPGATSTALLDGLVSSRDGPAAWAATVRPLLSHTSLQRLNQSAVRLRLPPVPRYATEVPETISIHWNVSAAPWDALPLTTSRKSMYARVVVVSPEPTARARLLNAGVTSPLLDQLSVASLNGDPLAVDVPILNVSLNLCCNASLKPLTNETELILIRGLRSLQSEPGGWNARIAPGLGVLEVFDDSVSFRVPPSLDYAISAPETIELVIPAAALDNWDRGDLHATLGEQAGPILAEPRLRIMPRTPALRVSEEAVPILLVPAFFWRPGLEASIPQHGTPQDGNALLVSDVRSRASSEKNLTLRLHDGTDPVDVWVTAEATAEVLMGGFASEQQQPGGWNEIVRYGAPPNISIANDTMVIAWPTGHFDDYAPRTPETVRLTVPGSAVASGMPLSLGSFVVTVDAGSVSLSGSLGATPTEAALRSAEPQTLRLTLEGDTWSPTVGLEGDATNALLSSLSSAQSEAAAWLDVVKPGLSSTDLEVLDAHTLVLTVPQRAAYDIAAPETISWNVPAEATFGLHRYDAPETIELLPTAGSARMLGSMMVRNTDAQLQNDEEINLVVRLTGDTWVEGVDQGGEVTRDLLAGLASAQSEAYGWNAVVRPFLRQMADGLNVTMQSDTELTIGIPSISLYDISITESISLTIPRSALVSKMSFRLAEPFVVYPAPPTATLFGDLMPSFTEFEVQSMKSFTLQVKVTGATFSRELAEYTASGVRRTKALVAGLRGSSASATGWNAVVQAEFAFGHVARLGDTLANITIPQVGRYSLTEPETILLTVPSLSLTYEPAPIYAFPFMVIHPLAVKAELQGTLLLAANNNEAALRDDTIFSIEIIIQGAAWGRYTQVADGGDGPTSRLLRGIRSAQNEPFGWNSVVAPILGPQHVRRFGDVVEIRVPSVPNYQLSRPETITVTLPGGDPDIDPLLWTMEGTTYDVVARPPFRISPDAGSAVVSGEAIGGVDEQWLSSGKAVVLTISLEDDTWVDAVGVDDFGDGPTTDLINGISASATSLTGWNNIIRPGIRPSNIIRLDDTTVRVTVDEFFDFDIQAAETVSVNVPASALVSDMAIVAQPSFELLPIASSATIGGEVAIGSSEVAIQMGLVPVLAIVLNSDTFVSAIGLEHDADGPTMQLIRGLTSAQSEPNGWNAVVQAGLQPSDVRYVSASEVQVHIPQFPQYDITRPETIVLTIPAACMRNNPTDIQNAASFELHAARGEAELSGSVLGAISEAELRSGLSDAALARGLSAENATLALEISLVHDTFTPWSLCEGGVQNVTELVALPLPPSWCWPPAPAPPGWVLPPSPPPFAPACAEQQYDGWNRVLASVPCSSVHRLSDRRMRLEVPAFTAYDIDASETISVTLRAGALSSHQPTTAAITFSVVPNAGTALLSGTLLRMDESGMRAGGGTLTISVVGDSWKPTLGDELRMEILSGLASVQLEAQGWTNVVRGALRPEHLELLGPEAVRVTLPPSAAYNLVLAETVAVQIPAAALVSGRMVDADALIELAAVPGRAIFSGYSEYDSTEAALQWGTASRWSEEANALLTAPLTLTVTLLEEEWAPEVGSNSAVSAALLATLTSAQDEPAGWNAVVRPALSHVHLLRLSDTVLQLTLPQRANYEISAAETLQVTFPPQALRSNQSLTAPLLAVEASRGVAVASGEFLHALHEEELSSRELTLELTLLGDSWVPLLEQKFAHKLIEGLTATSSQPAGWNLAVQPTLFPRHVTRVDARTVRISLPATPAYDIYTPETVEVHIPGGALVSNRPLTVEPGLRMLPTPGSVRFASGSLLEGCDEAALQSAEDRTLHLELVNDTWTDAIFEHDMGQGSSSQLIRGLRSSSMRAAHLGTNNYGRATGWDAVVQPALRHTNWHVHIDEAHAAAFAADPNSTGVYIAPRPTVAVLTLPQLAEYRLHAPESIEATIPPSATASGQRVRALAPLRVDVTLGTARLDGSLLAAPTEASLRSAATVEVEVLLQGDMWAAGVGDDHPATVALLAGLRSAQDEPAGWNAAVLPALDFRHVTVDSPTALRIELRQVAFYQIDEPETITASIPATALASDLPVVASPQIVIRATPGSVVCGGSFATAPTEAAIAGAAAIPGTLRLTLQRDSWSPSIVRAAALHAADSEQWLPAAERATVHALIEGIVSEQSEPAGWTAVMVPLLAATANITLEDNGATLLLDVPATEAYGILAPETIFVRIPPVAVASAATLLASPPLVVYATPGEGTFGGTLAASPLMETVQAASGGTLLIELSGDTWAPSVGLADLDDTAGRLGRELLAGLVSAQSEPGGWNAVVQPRLDPARVSQLDATTLQIELPQLARYAISEPETISFAAPGAATRTGVPVLMSAPLILRPTLARARLSGSLMARASEEAIREAGALQLTITLDGDEWLPAVGRQGGAADEAVARQLIEGLRPSQAHDTGWAAVVQRGLDGRHVRRISSVAVALSVPQLLSYDIAAPETIDVLIPASALLSGQPLPAVPAIRLVAANGTLILGGTLLESETEATVQTGGGTTPTSVPRLRLELADDTWLDGLGGTVVHGAGPAANASVEAGPAEAAAYALIRGLQSQQAEAKGWNAVVQAALRPWHVIRVSNTTLEVLLPDERANYDIASPETVRVTAPEAALTSARQVQGLPSFVIRPTRGVGRLSNSLVGNNSEADVQGGGMAVTVTLEGDSWAPSIGQKGSGSAASLTQQVLRAFISAQDERSGWNTIVTPELTYTDVSYVSGSSVTVQLPPFPVYDLQKAELISGARSVVCSGSASLRLRVCLSVCRRPELTPPAPFACRSQSTARHRRLGARGLRGHRRVRAVRVPGAADLGQHRRVPAEWLALLRCQRDVASLGTELPHRDHAHGRHVDAGRGAARRDGQRRLRPAHPRLHLDAVGELRVERRRARGHAAGQRAAHH